MNPGRFTRIALTAGAILLPLLSPAWTIPGLVLGLPKATIGGLAAACTLAVANRKEGP